MNKNHKTAIAAGGAAVALSTLLFFVIGPGDSPDGSGEERSGQTIRITASKSPTPTPTSTGPLMYTLKDKASQDGVTVSLKNFQRGRTTDVGVPEDTNYVRLTVTVKNTTDEPLDLDDLTVICVSDEVFDGTNGLDGVPDVHVLPDKALSWDIACAQNKSEEYFQLEIRPQHEDGRIAIFSGTVE